MNTSPVVKIRMRVQNLNRSLDVSQLIVYEIFHNFNAETVEGRFFSKEMPTDESNYILNETAVKAMGIDSPIGKPFSIAYLIVKKWLRDYAYRINIGLEIFIFSAVLVFSIAVLTVS